MIIESITCASLRYKEFPELLFGTSTKGIGYCDATYYIQNKGDAKFHNVEDFKRKYACWIDAVCETYELNPDSVVVIDTRGHYLIDESLALILVAYLDPEFGVYMLERITEMLITGVTLSDTYIMLMAKERLSKEQLTILLQT